MAEREKILEVRDLNISFRTDSGIVNAIRGVNLDLYKGETIAIVGESGSGKSVTTKAIIERCRCAWRRFQINRRRA